MKKINEALLPLSRSIDSLHEDPDNARKHVEQDLRVIANSLSEYGQQKPIVATTSGKIIAGNGTYIAARDILGWEELAVVTFDDDSKTRQTGYALVDNRSSELSSWDFASLSVALESMPYEELNGLGWTDKDIEAILGSGSSVVSGLVDAYGASSSKEITDLGSGTHTCPKCGFDFDE